MPGVPRRPRLGERRIAVVDAGKSTTRATVFAGEDSLARLCVPEGFPHPEAPGALDSVVRTMDDVLGQLAHGPYDALVLAATGVRRIGEPELRLQAALAQHCGCEVFVENDVAAAYLGALGPRPGILVQAGTGSLLLAVAENRPPVVLDGWGHLVGDRGSGFALGQAGLRAAFSALDGAGPATALTGSLLGTDPEATIRELYASEAQTREVAARAPLVLRAAADGDDVALDAVFQVASALVALVLAAARRLEDPRLARLPVAGVGGLFTNVVFRDAVTRNLHAHVPHVHLQDGVGDSLDGARLLATTRHDPITRALISAFRNEES